MLVVVAFCRFVHIASNIQTFSTVKRSIKLLKKSNPTYGLEARLHLDPRFVVPGVGVGGSSVLTRRCGGGSVGVVV